MEVQDNIMEVEEEALWINVYWRLALSDWESIWSSWTYL